MPRYLFHFRDGTDHPDKDGTQLADATAARSDARRAGQRPFPSERPPKASTWTANVGRVAQRGTGVRDSVSRQVHALTGGREMFTGQSARTSIRLLAIELCKFMEVCRAKGAIWRLA